MNSTVVVPVVPSMHCKQPVAELSTKLESELVVQRLWLLKQSELENVVQLLVGEVAMVLRWRQ